MVKAFSILLLSVACAVASAASIKAPLHQRGKPTVKEIVHADNHRWAKLNSHSKVIPAINADYSYYIEVDVGHPAQKTELLFDTGSSVLWVANTQFDASKSTTAKDLHFANLLGYGSGNVTVEFYKDNINIGGYKVRQEFGVADDTSAIGVEGIIGFGPIDLAEVENNKHQTYNVPTPMDNLYSSHQISTEVVGVDFKPIYNGAQQVANGEIDIGGIDHSKYKGKLNYVPITKTSPAKYYWGVDITRISFGNHVATTGGAGIVDTGTTLILLQQNILSNVFSEVPGAAFDNNSGLYAIPHGQLKKLKDITFTIGGKPFTLSPQQYLVPKNQYTNFGLSGDLHYTYFSILDFFPGLDAIIGQKFLENFYSVFDTTNNRVGLALRK
ncbi:aspartic peptidase domain-containing protein [Dissophora ornata]|nr:aspartic peptidase domain-containing protein [Dissophora ornata]